MYPVLYSRAVGPACTNYEWRICEGNVWCRKPMLQPADIIHSPRYSAQLTSMLVRGAVGRRCYRKGGPKDIVWEVSPPPQVLPQNARECSPFGDRAPPASTSLTSLTRASSSGSRSPSCPEGIPGVRGVMAPLPGRLVYMARRLEVAEPYPESVRVLYGFNVLLSAF